LERICGGIGLARRRFDRNLIYYGKPAHWKMRVGFFQIGNLQWELIQPLEGPNIFTDFLKEHGPGLHHIRFYEPDFDQHAAAFTSSRHSMISNGKGIHKVSRWAYFDTRAVLNGYLLEMRSYKQLLHFKDQTMKPEAPFNLQLKWRTLPCALFHLGQRSGSDSLRKSNDH
jgi:hypothetical protein